MFGVDSSELLLIALVALVVIGPKDLPRVMRVVGQWVGRARGMARHFRSGLDAMIREAEMEEMDKQWQETNARIMRDHPAASDSEWGQPATDAPPAPAADATPPRVEAAQAAADVSKPIAPPRRPSRPRKPRSAPPIPVPPSADERP